MTLPEDARRIYTDCWDRAVYAFATGEIFSRRSRSYRRKLEFLTALGIIVPLAIGGYVLAFGTESQQLARLLPLAAVLGLVQLVFSGVAVVYSWPDRLEYALTSVVDNLDIATHFKELAETAPHPPEDLGTRYAVLKARDDARRQADASKGVSQMELRFGHRAGLRQFKRCCSACGRQPVSMKPSDCEVCGSFRRWWS